jgi:pimeloyl-ACP methyl ester carboxylesterase
MPAVMHEIAPAPGDRLMSQEATKNASQVDSDMFKSPIRRSLYGTGFQGRSTVPYDGAMSSSAAPLVRTIAGFVALAVVAYAGACWHLWQQQRDIIFVPSRDLRQTPADAGLDYEDVWLVSRGGADKLHGWWLPSSGPSAPTMLYLHGNDLNIGGNVERIARLYRMGFNVFAVDYRGYGKSDGGMPSEASVYEDAESAWTYVVQERRADPRRTVIYGHSLGGAVAIDLALRHPEARALIAESTFTSMSDMARLAYWMFPVDWLLEQRFDALSKVRRLQVPVLLIHGTADNEVPYAMSQRLFDAAPEPKRLVLIPGGGHEDSAAVGETAYTQAVRDFARAK